MKYGIATTPSRRRFWVYHRPDPSKPGEIVRGAYDSEAYAIRVRDALAAGKLPPRKIPSAD